VGQILDGLGFEAISITKRAKSEQIIKSWNLGAGTEHMAFSAYITARKPATERTVDDRKK
jgi:hypothetical protein